MYNLLFLSYAEFHSAKMVVKLAGWASIEKTQPFHSRTNVKS